MSECKPLVGGLWPKGYGIKLIGGGRGAAAMGQRSRPRAQHCARRTSRPLAAGKQSGRGLHSSTFQLNLSAFGGIGGAYWGCLGVVCEVLGGIRGCLGCILCQERLRLSKDVDECKPRQPGRSDRVQARCAQRAAPRGAGRGLHSVQFPLNLSWLCPFQLNLSLLCPPHDPI